MKKLFLFLAITGMLQVSCSKDDDDGGQDAAKAKVTMTLDGQAWESSSDSPDSPTGAVIVFNTNRNVIINGYAEDGSYVGLTISSTTDLEVGIDYSPSDPNNNFQAQYLADFGDVSTQFTNALTADGTFRFSSLNEETAKGTFSFTARNAGNNEVVTITNGSFEIDR